METQRVNTYKSGDGVRVFYIEQYDEATRQWLTIGDTYTDFKLATSIVEHHNLKQLLNAVTSA